MRRIATIVNENNQVTGLVHGPDAVNQQVKVNGRIWKFDFDEWMGPYWLKADGYTERKCQNPKKEVWAAFEKWHEEYRKENPRREDNTPENLVDITARG